MVIFNGRDDGSLSDSVEVVITTGWGGETVWVTETGCDGGTVCVTETGWVEEIGWTGEAGWTGGAGWTEGTGWTGGAAWIGEAGWIGGAEKESDGGTGRRGAIGVGLGTDTITVPPHSIPKAIAALRERSIIRSAVAGIRPTMVTSISCPLAGLLTLALVPGGRL